MSRRALRCFLRKAESVTAHTPGRRGGPAGACGSGRTKRAISRPPRAFAYGLLAAIPIVLAAAPVFAQGMKAYDTPYYTLKTDLPLDEAREVGLRVTQMFEEYQRRTSDFAGRVNRKLLFELHKDYNNYVQSTQAPGTAGIYSGDRLVASYWGPDNGETWHTIQHEGFHQFVDFAMGRDAIPIWANEGLAEYFGEGVWAGDNFYTGVIPPERLKRVQKKLKARGFESLLAMMTKSHAQWNAELNHENYDQAWMMVHFLAHADDGRYARQFGNFLALAHRAPSWQQLWAAKFGGDVSGFQDRWEKYWAELPPNPSAHVYAQATCSILTGFLARAAANRQLYDSFSDFRGDARAGNLKIKSEDWLPDSLLKRGLAAAPEQGEWSIEKRGGRKLVCTLPDGRRLEGSFRLQNGRVADVTVRVRPALKGRS